MSIVSSFEERMAVGAVAGKIFSAEFERMFEEHHDLVYRTAYGVTASVEDAEDVAQTIFLQILQREIPVSSMENPAGYLYRSAVNISLTLVRSRARRISTTAGEILASRPTPAADPAEEERRKLYEAISSLPAKMAEILILRYQHDFSDARIAKMLGTSRGVIAVTLYRARARLKKMLRASPGEEQ
jgi:RNA polymerase sigma factor (sigma-70 family)